MPAACNEFAADFNKIIFQEFSRTRSYKNKDLMICNHGTREIPLC